MFQGRESLLESIRQNLLQTSPRRLNHRLAIHGLGGIGKTQIAVEYAYRHRADYKHVIWLHAAERTSMISDLAKFSRETNCIQVKDESQLEVIALQVLKWLNRQDKCLVILDNLDDVTVAKGLLPTSECRSHVLITTRNRDVKKIPAEGLEVTEMSEADAIELLIQASESQHDEQTVGKARRTVWELGMLPLAIDQAAAFIRMSGFDTFLSAYRSNAAELLKTDPGGNHPYPMSLFKTWSISLGRLSVNSIGLAQLLAFLNPDEILVDFLEAGWAGLDATLRKIIVNKFVFIKTT